MINNLATLLLALMTVSLVMLGVILSTTTPTTAGALGILSLFIFGYITVVVLLTFFLYTLSKVLLSISHIVMLKKPMGRLSFKRAYYYSSVLGLAPVIVVSMMSVGVFGAYEFGLVALLLLIGCVYVTKRTL